jgi:hypothetical protein
MRTDWKHSIIARYRKALGLPGECQRRVVKDTEWANGIASLSSPNLRAKNCHA